MKNIFCFILLAATNYLLVAQTPTSTVPDPNWTNQWIDNLTGSGFGNWWGTNNSISANAGNWGLKNQFDGGEPQVYQNSNVTQNSTDGLVFTTQQISPTTGTFPCTSCISNTKRYSSGEVVSFSTPTTHENPQFGYIEAVIKMSNTYGMFPAFWLNSTNDIFYFGASNGKLITVPNGGSIGSSSSTSLSSSSLNAAFFIDKDNGYVVGNSGTVLNSTNASSGSPTWSSIASSLSGLGTTNLNSVCFTNVNTGYIVGAGGKIYSYTNLGSGGSWAQTIPTGGAITQNLNSIYFPGANNGFTNVTTGYIAGDAGRVLKTTDGATWNPVTISGASSYNFKSVFSTEYNNPGGLFMQLAVPEAQMVE